MACCAAALIERLTENADFLETCFLLSQGELPTDAEKDVLHQHIKNHTMVHEQLKTFFNGFRAHHGRQCVA
jgi:citrate synthase